MIPEARKLTFTSRNVQAGLADETLVHMCGGLDSVDAFSAHALDKQLSFTGNCVPSLSLVSSSKIHSLYIPLIPLYSRYFYTQMGVL